MSQVCKCCGEILIEDLVDYKKQILGEMVIIPKVEGFRCKGCGHIMIDPKIKDVVEIKILEEEMKIRGKHRKLKKVHPVLISRLRSIRLEKEISQRKIGEALGFTEQRYGLIERSENIPSVYLAYRLAQTLGVEVADLYFLESIPYDLCLELRDLDSDLKPIEGLPELREECEEIDRVYQGLLNEIRELGKDKTKISKLLKDLINDNKKVISQNGIEDVPSEIEKLKVEIKEIEESLVIKKKKAVELKERKEKYTHPNKGGLLLKAQRPCVLKQGDCIDSEDWEKIKIRYADRLKTNE